MSQQRVHNLSGVENTADLAGYIVSYVVQCVRDEIAILNDPQAEPHCSIAKSILRSIDNKAIDMKPELGRIIEECLSQPQVTPTLAEPIVEEFKDERDFKREFHVEPAEYYAMKAVINAQNNDLNDLKNLIIRLTKERLEMEQELKSLKGEIPKDAIC